MGKLHHFTGRLSKDKRSHRFPYFRTFYFSFEKHPSMPNTFLLFTGTGNSLAVARQLAAELGETDLVPIPKAMNAEIPVRAPSGAVGFVFPVSDTRRYEEALILLCFLGIPHILRFSSSVLIETISMAISHELRIATASINSIQAATKVSPNWGSSWENNRTPPNTRSPYTANGKPA